MQVFETNEKCNANWKLNLKVLLFWCVSPWRNSANSNEDILFICNFLKNTVVKSLPKSLRTEFDNELLEIIYHIAEDNNSEEGDNLQFTSSRLYVLINELYQLKLITIASYLRKLIASGIFIWNQVVLLIKVLTIYQESWKFI